MDRAAKDRWALKDFLARVTNDPLILEDSQNSTSDLVQKVMMKEVANVIGPVLVHLSKNEHVAQSVAEYCRDFMTLPHINNPKELLAKMALVDLGPVASQPDIAAHQTYMAFHEDRAMSFSHADARSAFNMSGYKLSELATGIEIRPLNTEAIHRYSVLCSGEVAFQKVFADAKAIEVAKGQGFKLV